MAQRVEESGARPAPGPHSGGGGPVLEIHNIEVIYEDVILVLRGLSLSVGEGEIVALLGSNGAGKSTTLKAVAGLTGLEEINNFLKAKNTDAAAKGQGYVQGWYTMAVMSEGIKNAVAAGGTLDGAAIKAGLEQIKDFKTGVSDPITFSSTYHAGLLSAPLYQVEGGQWKKIEDPIKVEK